MLCMFLAMGLAACGGDDDSDETAVPETTPTDTAAAPETTTTETEPSTETKGGLTPPGASLSYGEAATVGWTPPSLSLEGDGKTVTLEISVLSVEEGTQDDFKNIELDADQKDSTPYYLSARVENLGGDVPPDDRPHYSLAAIDDRKQEQGSVTFFGDFPPCEDVEPPKPFGRGESYETCLTYLVPGGGSIEEVRWSDGPADRDGVSEYFDNPIVWK
jgi:hypothetical protein